MKKQQFSVSIAITGLSKLLLALYCLLLCVQTASAQERLAIKPYERQEEWKKLQHFIPANYQFTSTNKPLESAWMWENHTIHIDRFNNPKAPAKIILLHPIATNGRLMSMLVGAQQAKNGFEVISPDLPGFGLTKIAVDAEYTYDGWVRMLDSLIANEKQKDPRPVFLVGIGSGGMLAFHTAQINGDIAGMVVTSLYETGSKNIEHKMAQNALFAKAGQPLAKLIGQSKLWGIPFSSAVIYSHKKTVNNADIRKVLERDPTEGGAWLPARFVESYLNYESNNKPADFNTCPVLLAYPENDKLLSLADNLKLLNQLTAVKTSNITLSGASDIPFENAALEQLNQAIADFVTHNSPTSLSNTGNVSNNPLKNSAVPQKKLTLKK